MPAVLALLSACDQGAGDPARRAQQAFAAHDYVAARNHVAAALREQPGNRELLQLQARALIELGDGKGAGDALVALAGKAALSGDLAQLAARAALLRREPETVERLLAGNASPEATRLRATAALQRGDVDGAAVLFEKAVAEGGNAQAMADYARVLLIQGDLAKAERAIHKAEAAAPDDLPVMQTAGDIALAQDKPGLALALYDGANRRYPGNLAVLSGRARALATLGRKPELADAVKQLDQLMPGDADVAELKAALAAMK